MRKLNQIGRGRHRRTQESTIIIAILTWTAWRRTLNPDVQSQSNPWWNFDGDAFKHPWNTSLRNSVRQFLYFHVVMCRLRPILKHSMANVLQRLVNKCYQPSREGSWFFTLKKSQIENSRLVNQMTNKSEILFRYVGHTAQRKTTSAATPHSNNRQFK